MTVDFEIHNRVTGEVLADTLTCVEATDAIRHTAENPPRRVTGLVGDGFFDGADPDPRLVADWIAARDGDLVVVAVFSEDPS